MKGKSTLMVCEDPGGFIIFTYKCLFTVKTTKYLANKSFWMRTHCNHMGCIFHLLPAKYAFNYRSSEWCPPSTVIDLSQGHGNRNTWCLQWVYVFIWPIDFVTLRRNRGGLFLMSGTLVIKSNIHTPVLVFERHSYFTKTSTQDRNGLDEFILNTNCTFKCMM